MVYLIDDDESVRRGFRLFLDSAGIDHQSFQSADEFLMVYKPHEADLLVLDLNLPGTNGIDLLKTIDRLGIHLSVVVVTAHDEPKSREYCKQFGVKAYLRKPVDAEALLDIIRYDMAK
jgi:FixJ family two-component response regulator